MSELPTLEKLNDKVDDMDGRIDQNTEDIKLVKANNESLKDVMVRVERRLWNLIWIVLTAAIFSVLGNFIQIPARGGDDSARVEFNHNAPIIESPGHVDGPYMDTSEAAELAKVNADTLRRRIAQGHYGDAATKDAGGKWLIDRAKFAAALAGCE